MTDKQFSMVWADALVQKDADAFVSDWALSTTLTDGVSDIDPELVSTLFRIYDAAHMSVRDIAEAAGISQSDLSRKYCIPLKTVQNWCADQNTKAYRECPDYVRLLLAKDLGLL